MKHLPSYEPTTANYKRNPLQVKSYVFTFDAVESGEADEIVNTFCTEHGAMSIVFDRHNGKVMYRIIYRERS